MRSIALLGGLLIACGGGGAAGDDQSGDGGVAGDGADIDAPPTGPVTVTVRDVLGPRAGVRIVFQAADSSLVADSTTDAAGKASAMVPPGGFVTAVEAFGPGQGTLRTIAGVQPGDQLLVQLVPPGPPVTQLMLTLPRDPTAGVNGYAIASRLGSLTLTPPAGTGPFTVPLSAPSGDQDLAIMSMAGSHAIGAFYVEHAALVANGILDLSSRTYSAIAPTTYTFTHPPLGSGTFVISRQSSAGVELTDLTIGSHHDPAVFDVMMPAVPTIAHEVARLVANSPKTYDISVWSAGPLATTDLDGRLPDLTAGGYDATTHRYTWTGTGAAVTFATSTFTVQRSGGSNPWIWAILAPGDPSGVTWPLLPADLATYNPIATDTITGVMWASSTSGVSYNQIRRNGVLASRDYAAPMLGRLVFGGVLPDSGFSAAQRLDF